MALNFPSTPSANAVYTYNGRSWTYNGNAWALTTAVLDTSVIPESGNLYFTNARVVSALTAGQNITLDGNGRINASVSGGGGGGNVDSVAGATGAVSNVQIAAAVSSSGILTTANIVELTNLYYTQARFDTALGNKTTSNVTEGANLYFTDARVYSNVTSLGYITSSALSGYATNTQLASFATTTNVLLKSNITDLTTANVVELTNLYFTNARVYSAVTGNLALKSNVADLTTANVSELTNLYYTNARVYSAVTGNLALKSNVVDLTTSNVSELTNLYYTDARVYSNVTQRLASLDTNVIPSVSEVYSLGSPSFKFKDLYLSGNTILLGATTLSSTDDGLTVSSIRSNVWNGLYTSNVVETAGNLYYTNARVYAAVTGNLALKSNVVDLTTANVTELTNLYYTNARVYSAVTGNLALKSNVVDLTTANVAELTNLYYTDARVYSAVTGNLALKSNIADLTTANVTELNNLYFTNARVYSNVTSLGYITSSALTGYATNTQLTSFATVSNVLLKANITDLTTANVSELTNLYFTDARVYSAVTGNLALKSNVSDLTTANVSELTNLYFTNARVVSALTAGQNITLDANGRINSTATGGAGGSVDSVAGATGNISNVQLAAGITSSGILTTANVAELTNLYYTNARVYSAVTGNLALKSNIADLTTANVAELTNLYYTDARVYSNVSALGYITTASLSGYATTSYVGNALANLVASAPASLDTLNELATALGNDNNFSTTVLTYIGTKANTVSLTTANVSELTNLYFTNARSIAALTAGQSITIDANGRINSSAVGGSSYGDSNVALLGYATNANVALKANTADLTTANVVELTNLYYTNARVYSNVVSIGYITSSALSGYATNSQLASYATNAQLTSYQTLANATLKANVTDLTTANVVELTNLYFTNARVYSAVTGNLVLKANIADLTTANVTEVTNLYFTNARVYSNVTSLGYITSSALTGYATNTQLTSYVTSASLTTANVSELTNLYFTNARVYSAVTGNLALKANIADLTTANVTELTNLYFTNARSIAALTAGQSITIDANGRINSSAVGGGGGSTYGDSNVAALGYATNANVALKANITDLTTANVTEVTNLYYTQARFDTALGNKTTSNVTEGTNLYFTNARVYSAVTGNLALKSNVTDLTTANVSELTNLYYTNARVYSNVTSLGYITASSLSGYATNTQLASFITSASLTTANVSELTNLYFTNARVYSSLTAGAGISISSGTISAAPRIVAITDAASVTIDGDTTDIATQVNTQAVGTLTINAVTGTLSNGQKIIFRLQSTNVQTFSWNAVFVGSTDLALPTVSSGASKYDYVGFMYNTTASKWQLLAKNFGF
jgi:hypothetical protein